MGKLKSVLPVAQAVHRLCRLGGMPEPRWLAAAERLGLHVREPAPKQRPRVLKPPRIEFPEDRVITSILARRPELKSLPVDHGAPSASSSSPLREVALRAAEQLRKVPAWDRATRRTILAAAADEAAARAAAVGSSGGVPSPAASSSSSSSASAAAAIGGGGLVEAAQRAEEAVLMQALARARASSRAGGGAGSGGTAAAAAFAAARGAAARQQQQRRRRQ